MNDVDYTKKSPTVLSLCSGYSGLELGLERIFHVVRVLAYVEIEAFVITNLVAKMEEGKMATAPIWSDLKTLPLGPFRDRVEILTGGFPCQPFSNAGKKKGVADERHLYPIISNIIAELKPGIVFLENVEGIISVQSGDGVPVLLHVLRDLEKRGYLPTWGVFSADEVGAPHKRKRVFILAHANDKRTGREAELLREAQWGSRRSLLRESEFSSDGSEELADTDGQGLQGASLGEKSHGKSGQRPNDSASKRRFLWPAGFGEKQHDWEVPRSIESELGRTTHGTTRRVDRIRLLGNGVVPQTAERAFRVLSKQLFQGVT